MLRKILSLAVIVCFILTTLNPIPQAHADSILGLPTAGNMVNLSPAYEPVIIKGLTVHKDNPFLFDFIVDVGQDKVSGEPLKKEGEELIKYFLASLAIPDKDVWVNLSPYEKNRMIPEALGQTDMGRDLLEQDYILKQITASLIYPEKKLGKTFWERVYAKAQEQYGTTQIPVNTFNKVWIMADRAQVFEHNQTAFVVDSHLKVMLEEDYLALTNHQIPTPGRQPGDMASAVSPSTQPGELALNAKAPQGKNFTHNIASNIIRQIILPELEKEINTGKNFANLRQIFNSIILASWYRNNLKQALLNQVYANQSKIKSIDLKDPTVKEQIYEQYLKAYKIGVFNYIKEDVNIANGQTIPRKYFSGGINEAMAAHPQVIHDSLILDAAMGFAPNRLVNFKTEFFPQFLPKKATAVVTFRELSNDEAMIAGVDWFRRVGSNKIRFGWFRPLDGSSDLYFVVLNGKSLVPSNGVVKFDIFVKKVKSQVYDGTYNPNSSLGEVSLNFQNRRIIYRSEPVLNEGRLKELPWLNDFLKEKISALLDKRLPDKAMLSADIYYAAENWFQPPHAGITALEIFDEIYSNVVV